MFKVNAIVPKPLKIEAEDELATQFRRLVPFIILDFGKSTTGWEHPVTFRYRIRTYKSKNVMMRIWTDDEIWNWVNFGTEGPYDIEAGFWTGKSDKKALTIHEHKPATMPAVLASNPSKRGLPVALRRKVTHPGIKARRFDVIVKLRYAAQTVSIIRETMDKLAERSGHAIRST